MSIQRPSRYFSVVLELRMWITYGGKNFLKSVAKRVHSFPFISFCTKLNSTLFDTILDHATIKLANEARSISTGRFSNKKDVVPTEMVRGVTAWNICWRNGLLIK